MNAILRMTCAAALIATVVTPGFGQTAKIEDRGVFDIAIRGIRAATLTFSGVQQGNRYSVVGQLKSVGLVSFVRKVSYDAKANGAVSNNRFTPFSYTENADTGKRQSQSQIDYNGGVPQQIKYSPTRPPRPDDVNPATMAGTVDPLTSLYATLRDVDKGQECKTSVKMFDGKRSSQITLSKPNARGSNVVCSGEYRRLQGFSEKDMSEKTRFHFTLTYSPTDQGRMRVTEVALDTLYGKATMKRR